MTKVFEDVYGFTAEQRSVNVVQRPQLQVNHYLAEVVLEHNSDHTLLIVYHVGDGWNDEKNDELKLYGYARQNRLPSLVFDTAHKSQRLEHSQSSSKSAPDRGGKGRLLANCPPLLRFWRRAVKKPPPSLKLLSLLQFLLESRAKRETSETQLL